MAQPEIRTTVRPDQLLSHPALVKEIDCLTVQPHELKQFDCKFAFPITQEGTLHGFCVWFDVVFDPFNCMKKKKKEEKDEEEEEEEEPKPKGLASCGNEVVTLTTAPGAEATHWKQTLILLPDGYGVDCDAVLSGAISFSASAENPRHYNISIALGDQEEEEEEGNSEKDEKRSEGVYAISFFLSKKSRFFLPVIWIETRHDEHS